MNACNRENIGIECEQPRRLHVAAALTTPTLRRIAVATNNATSAVTVCQTAVSREAVTC